MIRSARRAAKCVVRVELSFAARGVAMRARGLHAHTVHVRAQIARNPITPVSDCLTAMGRAAYTKDDSVSCQPGL